MQGPDFHPRSDGRPGFRERRSFRGNRSGDEFDAMGAGRGAEVDAVGTGAYECDGRSVGGQRRAVQQDRRRRAGIGDREEQLGGGAGGGDELERETIIPDRD